MDSLIGRQGRDHFLPGFFHSSDACERTRDTEALMRCLRDDDPGALDAIIALHWREVVGYAAGFVECGDEAEDLAQHAFIGLWEQRKDWADRGTVLSFLLRVVRNRASNERRHQRIRSRLEPEIVAATTRTPTRPDEHLAGAELARRLGRTLLRMPDRRREVFELARFQDLSYGEIADVLEISPQTVANHVSAALSELREALGADVSPPSPRRSRAGASRHVDLHSVSP